MADQIPLILNTSANQIQEMPSGDTLDLTGSNIKGVGILTVTTIDCNGDLDVDGHINFDNLSIAGVSTFTGAITANGSIDLNSDLDVDGHTNLDNVNVAGVTTFAGVIEGVAGQNKIPSLYNAMTDLPSAGTYHGMFAHVHATQRGYFAHGGGWYELVNKESTGVVGTGTERYSIGALVSTSTTATSLNVSGVTTAVTVDINGDLDVDGHTNLDNVNVAGVTTFAGAINGSSAAFAGNVSVGGVLTYEDVTNVDSIGIITARSGVDVDDFISVGSNIHLGNAGVVTATTFSGSGASLTSIPAGQLTGTVADARISTLTASKLSGALPAIDGSNLTGLSAGIPGISTTGLSGFNHVNVGGAMTCTGTIVNKIDATTENAVIIGFEANKNNTNTDGSVIIGYRAGYQNATGKGYNTFLGYNAGYAGGGTNGSNNTMIGSGSGLFMYGGGNFNAALGMEAGYFNNKNYCVSIGAKSGHSRGEFNVAIGGHANGAGNVMDSNYMTYPSNNNSTQNGDNNICIGYQSNPPTSEADNYIVIGNKKHTNFVVGTLGVEVTAGVTTHAGSVVVGAGVSVVGIVTAANFLKADGSAVGGVTSDATYNTIGGTGAGSALTSNGRDNTFFGHEAGNDVTSGDYNSIFGAGAGELINTGGYNTCIGSDAGRKITNSSNNTLVGNKAGEKLGQSDANVSGCVMVGTEVGAQMVNGSYNVFIGHQAAQHMQSGRSNVCLGYLAGQGAYNNCTGQYNTAIGEISLYTVQSGSYNHVMGRYAGHSITTGSYNICIGDKAGAVNTYAGNSGDLTTGSNNIILGKEAQASSATVSNEITLGNSSITRFRIPGLGLDFNGNNLDLGDSKKIRLGNSQDLQLYHDGSNSYLVDGGTGNLFIRAAAALQVQGANGENMIYASQDGSVELYHNAVKKFETTGVGVKITGNARTDIVTVSDGSNITIPMNTGTHFTVTLGGNRTFINSNMQTSDAHGASGSIFIVQDGTGGRTAAFQSNYKFAGGTAPTLSTAANAVDRLDYVVRATDFVHCVLTLDVK